MAGFVVRANAGGSYLRSTDTLRSGGSAAQSGEMTFEGNGDLTVNTQLVAAVHGNFVTAGTNVSYRNFVGPTEVRRGITHE